ncbi:unnamed protein product, partial [Brenthis ino]
MRDQQKETQMQTLRHSEQENTNIPYGDAKNNSIQYNAPININPLPINTQTYDRLNKTHDIPSTTQSKATSKSDDDFDVNEYFARLQGTRYVSAPINSNLKEDQNANLQAEENLEEINLNEPDKSQNLDDVQNSLSADIAQNFSQLPTVIPQVASVVFSSFSNMLSLKSREQTPDTDNKIYQEPIQNTIQKVDSGQFMPNVQEVPKDVAPPPLREPPSGTASSYRITTKKKVYAQIPGLSSGDHHHVQSINPPPSGNHSHSQPNYFVPENITNVPQAENKLDNAHLGLVPQSSITQSELEIQNTSVPKNDELKSSHSFNTIQFNHSQKSENQPEFLVPTQTSEVILPKPEQTISVDTTNQSVIAPNTQTTPIIPPPPMFSNIRRDSQSSTGKSVLPPSVARRISGTQPIIRSQALPSLTPHGNIFVPQIPDTADTPGYGFDQSSQHIDSMNIISNVQNVRNTETVPQDIFMPNLIPIPSLVPLDKLQNPQINVPSNTSLFEAKASVPDAGALKGSIFSTDSLFSSEAIKTAERPIYPDSTYPEDKPNMSKGTSNIVNKEVNITQDYYEPQGEHDNISTVPPTFFNPAVFAQPDTNINKPENITSPHSQVSQYVTPPEASKPLVEPPKLTGNVNYRMSKKRPQYYSGPIEGVGNISNNIKPTIHPVEPSYQGSLFNPDTAQAASNTLYSDYNVSDVQATPFDISKPVNMVPPVHSMQQLPDFNTAFDLSRPTTESYEQPQQELSERKGFGIIGSLKSKLSAIDINKIQNKVTTFFDPAYNNTKVDDSIKQESKLYAQNMSTENYTEYAQNNAALEVFVPNVDQEQTYASTSNYLTDYSQQAYNPQYYSYNQDYMGNRSQDVNFQTNYDPVWYNNYNQQQFSTSYYQNTIAQNVTLESSNKNIAEISNQTENISNYFNQNVAVSPSKSSENENTISVVQQTEKELEHIIHNENEVINSQSSYAVPDDKPDIKEKCITLNTEENKSLTVTDQTSNLKNFFDISNQNVSIAFDSIKATQNNILDYSSSETSKHDKKSNETTLDNKQSVLPINIKRETGLITNVSPEDFFNDLPKITDPSSKGFFDKETPIVLPFEAKKLEENINKKVFREINEATNTCAPIKSFEVFDPVLGKSQVTDGQSEILEKLSTVKISESILPPLTFVKNCESKDSYLFNPLFVPEYKENKIRNDSSEKAPAFSLFKQSSNASSLFDLSSISSNPLSVSTELKDIKDLESKMENVSLFQNNDTTGFDQSLFGSIETTEIKDDLIENPVSELNICETCREVNKPEEKEVEDLTTQLIENITAPIQLANPVEYPVSEDFTEDPTINKVDFSTQYTEISHTEDEIQNLTIPPPVDLIDDMSVNNPILNYGWSTNEGAHSSKVLADHDYRYQVDPNSIGFFQDKSLFFENIPTNASDELKAEFKNSHEDTPILPRQMSIPTAPPEEDSKSDESGLDVHSIEQDAKKDFPIYEEVIEPSETDDDKIEYREREKVSDDSEQSVDTFTNRVERYKNANDNAFEVKKEIKTFDLPTSTSPAITIASYFDTGNYAVENHYRNSLTSPSTLSSFNTHTNTPMRFPPGFEEEYQRRLSGISSQDILPTLKSQNISALADVNLAPIIIAPQTLDDSVCDDNVESMIKELIEEDNNPTQKKNMHTFTGFVESENEKANDAKQEIIQETVKEVIKSEEIKLDSLPDPMNFFSSNVDNTQESDAYSDFSRLSSYFASPPKPEHSKSFFELSQSQNHYRHKPSQNRFDSIQNNVKNFFEDPNFNNLNKNEPKANAPQNMSLIHDLTSTENFTPNENIVRTVNYFTVDNIKIYENEITEIKTNELKTNLKYKTDDDKNENGGLKDIDETNFENVIINCKYCWCLTKTDVNFVNFEFKVRKAMNSNSESKEGANMETKKEGMKKSMTVNFCDKSLQEDADDRIVVVHENRSTTEYAPVKHHWFYKVDSEDKSIWRGFSVADSRALENAFNSPDLNENTLVATDGGRFDVNVMARRRTAVYWTEKPTNVMRCSWFYKGTSIDPRYIPYSEELAEKLEEEYRHGVTTGEWHRRLMLNNNEMVVMHGPSVMVHFVQNSSADDFATSPQSTRPRVVRRGHVESEIEDTEPSSIDHLLLLCHGVGSACDMRFRPVEEVVDDFRATSLQLIQSHYKNSYDSGLVGRVEVLPISWHASLHTGMGVDKRLAAVTLDSIPRLRSFTNDTILDVLFYTSPVFCQ